MGRGATGVRGMRLLKTFAGSEDAADDDAATDGVDGGADDASDTLADGARVMALIVAEAGDILTVSELGRSEEHTSELQSLMRISYAVFCLKKKTNEKSEKS